MKLWAERFYNSAAWWTCRVTYLQSVGGLCERCSTPYNPVLADVVHHRIHLTPRNINDPSISLSWEHLEALCQTCHNREHHGVQEGKRFEWEEDGSLSPPCAKSKRGERIPSGDSTFPPKGRA